MKNNGNQKYSSAERWVTYPKLTGMYDESLSENLKADGYFESDDCETPAMELDECMDQGEEEAYNNVGSEQRAFIAQKTENGSADYIDYWNKEYLNSKSLQHYDYYLLSMHNALQDAGYTLYGGSVSSIVQQSFESNREFYEALKDSSFALKTEEYIYTPLRLMGRWETDIDESGKTYYISMGLDGGFSTNFTYPNKFNQATGAVSTSFFPNKSIYYQLEGNAMSHYVDQPTGYDDTYLCDSFTFTFVSNDEIHVCPLSEYYNNKIFILKKV